MGDRTNVLNFIELSLMARILIAREEYQLNWWAAAEYLRELNIVAGGSSVAPLYLWELHSKTPSGCMKPQTVWNHIYTVFSHTLIVKLNF